MRFLPNETWSDVFQMLPINNLAQTIPLVDRRFAALADSVVIRCHPMVAKRVELTWDRKKCTHQLTIRSKRYAQPNPITHFPRYEMDFPVVPPLPNIVKIQRIRLEGHFDRDSLRFLGKCNNRIVKYRMEIEDLANFMGELNRRKIVLGEFFDAIGGSDCASIWLDGRHSFLSSDFFLNPVVLRCPIISIFYPHLGFDVDALVKWARWPIPQQGKRLVICGFEGVESVKKLQDKLIEKRREVRIRAKGSSNFGKMGQNPAPDDAKYKLELHSIVQYREDWTGVYDDGMEVEKSKKEKIDEPIGVRRENDDDEGGGGEDDRKQEGEHDNKDEDDNDQPREEDDDEVDKLATYIDIGTFGPPYLIRLRRNKYLQKLRSRLPLFALNLLAYLAVFYFYWGLNFDSLPLLLLFISWRSIDFFNLFHSIYHA